MSDDPEVFRRGGPRLELDPASIDAIARRVVELVDERLAAARTPALLIDVGELARRTGISRTWIYEHATELAAIRLGNGPKPRLRFNPDTVERLLGADAAPRSQTPPTPKQPRRPIRRTDVELLPIKRGRQLLSRQWQFCRRGH